MYKYLFFVVLGIIIFLLYNRVNGFSVGIPYFLYLKNDRDEWEVKNTLDPTLDLSNYIERLKYTFVYPGIVEAHSDMDRVLSDHSSIVSTTVTTDSNSCLNNPIFVDADETLNILNERLSSKCPSLRIVLDKPERLPDIENIRNMIETARENIDSVDLVLCLYYNEECISLLTIKISMNNTITISVITKDEYKRNKYAHLLINSLMICADKLIFCNRITTINNLSIYPLSFFYLTTNFSYTLDFHGNDTLQGEYEQFQSDYSSIITKQKIRDLNIILQRHGGIHVIIQLIPRNILSAQALFDILVSDSDNSIVCPYKTIEQLMTEAGLRDIYVNIKDYLEEIGIDIKEDLIELYEEQEQATEGDETILQSILDLIEDKGDKRKFLNFIKEIYEGQLNPSVECAAAN